MAEKVGFAPVLGVENKELKGFSFCTIRADPPKNPGGSTFWAREVGARMGQAGTGLP